MAAAQQSLGKHRRWRKKPNFSVVLENSRSIKIASRWPPSTSHRGYKKGLNNTDLNGLGIIQVAVIYIFIIRARFSTDSWPTFSFYPHPTTPLNPLICVSSHLTKLHSQHTHTHVKENWLKSCSLVSDLDLFALIRKQPTWLDLARPTFKLLNNFVNRLLLIWTKDNI